MLAVGSAAAAAGPAAALPGDPPVELRSPAAGATLPTGGELAYSCPIYRSADFGDGMPITHGEDFYTVLVATSPRLNAEGRLTEVVAQGKGESRPADPDLCFATLSDELALGRLYWQVSRLCSQCSPQYEASEVRSFDLVPATPPRLSLPARIYAGYAFIASLPGTKLAAGTEVVIERRTGSGWRKVARGSAPFEPTVLLGRTGRQTLRARAGTVISARRTVRVRSARSRVTSVRGGRWKGRASTAFRVRGRTLRGFTTLVPLLCPTPGMINPFTTQITTASVPRIRLAPDGSFVGVSTRSGSVRVRGRVAGGRLRGGRVEMSLGTCVGSAELTAGPA